MGAALFWTVVLATVLVQDSVIHCQALFSNSPWDPYNYYNGLLYDPYRSPWQAEDWRHLGNRGPYQGTGGMVGAGGFNKGGSTSSRFGGDYGLPRYGGSSRMSRYGIDYGRRRSYRRRSSADLSRGYGNGGSYRGYSNQFHGGEHPRSWYQPW
uniref:Putative glycine-rich secreted protein n=1 Tax=Amblyomma triste TaxID=251400 RepID=A0A023GD18_AMBTT